MFQNEGQHQKPTLAQAKRIFLATILGVQKMILAKTQSNLELVIERLFEKYP